MGKLKLTLQADDARKTKVKQSNVGGALNYWQIDLAGIEITLREEVFYDLLKKMQAANADWQRRLAEAGARLDAQRAERAAQQEGQR
jgi:hypothetical protein